MKFTRNEKGFTLIELLIVVAIIGILAAIAIPNLLTAMQRSKQKRTMADIRTIATAWEAFATDVNNYTPSGWEKLANPVTTDQLSAGLEPTYIRSFPRNDGWSRPYHYSTDGATNAQAYQVASGGKNGTIGEGDPGATTDFDCDIVYENGSFVIYPEGIQSSQAAN